MDLLVANIRTLIADMIETAKSGHPGSAITLVPLILHLHTHVLRFDPDTLHPLRDIFILSNAHACAVQYVFNFLLGRLTLEDIKSFRQLNSKTPGHCEKGNFVEITSEPLGQGISQAVGFAIALIKENTLRNVYCVFGDGCYEEGISQEAFSIAAHLNLNNLIFIYDSNEMTIDGNTNLSMTEDSKKRFEALNYDVIEITDDFDSFTDENIFLRGQRPKMLIMKSKIGRGTKFEGQNRMHGEPLGSEEISRMKRQAGIRDIPFAVMPELNEFFEALKLRKKAEILSLGKPKPEISKEIKISTFSGYVPEDLPIATRNHFKNALNSLPEIEGLIGGSADLTSSVNTKKESFTTFTADNRNGNYIHYGIREHAMFSIMNGLSASGMIPFSGTFLNFASYGFPAIRLACLDNAKLFYVFTHDSIGVGEDGPTHQPIEILALLRATPNLTVIRPCDGVETRFALKYALEKNGPTAIILSRQPISPVINTNFGLCSRGAYFIINNSKYDLTIIATGSEVSLCVDAIKILDERSIKANLISMPSWEIFEDQDDCYKKSILGDKMRVSVEMLSTFGWSKYSDIQIGIDRFGLSGKAKDLFDYFGFTALKIADRICNDIKNVKR